MTWPQKLKHFDQIYVCLGIKPQPSPLHFYTLMISALTGKFSWASSLLMLFAVTVCDRLRAKCLYDSFDPSQGTRRTLTASTAAWWRWPGSTARSAGTCSSWWGCPTWRWLVQLVPRWTRRLHNDKNNNALSHRNNNTHWGIEIIAHTLRHTHIEA